MFKLNLINGIAFVAIMAANMMTQAQTTQSISTQPATALSSFIIEAESGEPVGTKIDTARSGYSGNGYVTDFKEAADKLILHFDLPQPGVYLIEIRYSAPSKKGYELFINGITRSDLFPPTGDLFATHSAGKAELVAGNNTIEVRKGWGHFDIDRIELIPTRIDPMKKPELKLINLNATPEAIALMKQIVDDYGNKTYSGVHDTKDAKLILDHTGKKTAVMGMDLIDYSPTRIAHGAKSTVTPEKIIDYHKQGQLITLLWHWNAPKDLIDQVITKENGQKIEAQWYFGFYTRATTFDLADALSDSKGESYQLLLRDIDAIAEPLRKLQAANLPILWRPLHEADGGWFWWGAKGPDNFKKLWALLYDRLTNTHKLNNLIWVYTGSNAWDWYPPENQFDLIGVDAYPSDLRDPLSPLWDGIQARYGGRKLVTLSEFGGVPDVEGMARLGIHFSYFNSWSGKEGPSKNKPGELERIFNSTWMGNLKESTTPAR